MRVDGGLGVFMRFVRLAAVFTLIPLLRGVRPFAPAGPMRSREYLLALILIIAGYIAGGEQGQRGLSSESLVTVASL